MKTRTVRHGTRFWNIAMVALVMVAAATSFIVGELGIERVQQELRYLLIFPIIFIGLIVAVVVVFLVNFLTSNISLNKRRKAILAYAAEKNLQAVQHMPVGSTLQSIAKGVAKNAIALRADDWGYTDFVVTRYSEDPSQPRYKVKTCHFAVGVFDLPRALPHIFFDAQATGGREFKFLFHDDQKYDFEGDFPKYFSVHIAGDYAQDALQLLTPDVLQAFIAARHFDVEIYEDKMYLITELKDMPEQLIDIEHKGAMLRGALGRNMVRYADDRIEAEYTKKTISISGLRLRRSERTGTLVFWLGNFLLLAAAYTAIFQNVVMQVSLYLSTTGFGFLLYGLMTIFSVRRANKILGIRRHMPLLRV